MSVPQTVQTVAIKMLTALIQKEIIHANVMMDSLGMDLIVQVCIHQHSIIWIF